MKPFANRFTNSVLSILLLLRRGQQEGEIWHLDEVDLSIKGKKHWLWRAIDQEGYELEVLLQPRRNAKAAVRFFKKLLKGLCYIPRSIITDKLRSYKAAKKKVLKQRSMAATKD